MIRKFLCKEAFNKSLKYCLKDKFYDVVDRGNRSTFIFENGEMTLSKKKMEEFLNERSDVLKEIEDYA